MTSLWRPALVVIKNPCAQLSLASLLTSTTVPTSKDAADTVSRLALGRAGCLSPQNPAQGLAQSRHLVNVMDRWADELFPYLTAQGHSGRG